MTIAPKINVAIEGDTNGFNGDYNYRSGDNHYKKDGSTAKYLVYSEGGVSFLSGVSQYYWAIPCQSFELLYNKTIPFNKSSGGTAKTTVTPISEAKKSTATKKIKWSK